MCDDDVKLFGNWASPFSHRAELALKLKGIKYDYVEEDPEKRSPLLLHHNPVHNVPVLVHNGRAISESLVILEYIEETWGHKPCLPEEPYDRAMCRFWARFVDDKIYEATLKVHETEHAIDDILHHLKLLEGELKEREFFGGLSFGYLDIVGLSTIQWFHVRQEAGGVDWFNEDKFPTLFKWHQKMISFDVVKDSLPPREKHVHHFRAHFESVGIHFKTRRF